MVDCCVSIGLWGTGADGGFLLEKLRSYVLVYAPEKYSAVRNG